jgi:hypothetical protein
MCPQCERRLPENPCPRPRTRRRAEVPRGRAAVHLDPVRSLRVRGLIAQCIATGLGPSFVRILGQPLPLEYLHHPERGPVAVARVRQAAVYLAHVGCGLSFAESGRLYGRDRSTAAHACSIIEDSRDEVDFDRLMAALEAAVRLGLRQVDPWLAEQAPRH